MRINFHIIFDNDRVLIPRIKTWLHSLECLYKGGKQEKLGNVKIPEDSLNVTLNYLHVVETLEKDEGLKDKFLVRDVVKSKRLFLGIFSKISTGEPKFSSRREH